MVSIVDILSGGMPLMLDVVKLKVAQSGYLDP